ncbi:cysteine hydrolase family protein [Hazenella coriacea]|uniref:Nicotinamidase-related amidase n=1 Tax=Hazenella coriacea TaxID=1179467 RepID=A0A4R3L231_9BACL|nr:cysteine hydrolase family protein [Hazenella coriacea]TCS93593.1 nicotinamidase-related amidase [Hazenella coriacea]
MKTGLLIIDIQNDYFPGGKAELHHPLKALENAQVALKIFRKQRLPVIHVQHLSLQEEAGFFLPNTDGVKIHPEVQPLANEYLVQKHFPNSFLQSNLLDLLQKEQIQNLVVCGMMSHMCINATVRAARDFGFQITLLEDACATKDLIWNGKTIPASQLHESFMAALAHMYYADVVQTDQWLSSQ